MNIGITQLNVPFDDLNQGERFTFDGVEYKKEDSWRASRIFARDTLIEQKKQQVRFESLPDGAIFIFEGHLCTKLRATCYYDHTIAHDGFPSSNQLVDVIRKIEVMI